MPCKAIICDWNGTITAYRDEKPLMEAIAKDILRASIPFHPLKMARILRSRGKLAALYDEKRQDDNFDYVVEMFKIFNKRIIKGTSVSLITDSVERYANRPETQSELDHRILRAIKGCHQAGKTTAILSAGYRYGIERILQAAGFQNNFDLFEGDTLKVRDGRAVEFELKLYKRKPEVLSQLLRERNIDPQTVAYIGDSEDDEGCLEIAGYPVMSFFAPEELKQEYAQKYGAFVPEKEPDLLNYLSA